MIDLSLHVFETLRKDEEFILYRGKSNLAPPVLVLSPALQHPVPQSLNRLQHEYSLKEELNSNFLEPVLGSCELAKNDLNNSDNRVDSVYQGRILLFHKISHCH